jgi:hypothetical protein
VSDDRPDRPRYRVLARPFYDHEPDARPEHPDGAGHDRDGGCAAGHELLVLAPDPAGLGRPWQVLGVTQTDLRGPLDAGLARDAVRAWLRLRADPDPLRVDEDRVELYREVTDP